jgi:hypothetical protein
MGKVNPLRHQQHSNPFPDPLSGSLVFKHYLALASTRTSLLSYLPGRAPHQWSSPTIPRANATLPISPRMAVDPITGPQHVSQRLSSAPEPHAPVARDQREITMPRHTPRSHLSPCRCLAVPIRLLTHVGRTEADLPCWPMFRRQGHVRGERLSRGRYM